MNMKDNTILMCLSTRSNKDISSNYGYVNDPSFIIRCITLGTNEDDFKSFFFRDGKPTAEQEAQIKEIISKNDLIWNENADFNSLCLKKYFDWIDEKTLFVEENDFISRLCREEFKDSREFRDYFKIIKPKSEKPFTRSYKDNQEVEITRRETQKYKSLAQAHEKLMKSDYVQKILNEDHIAIRIERDMNARGVRVDMKRLSEIEKEFPFLADSDKKAVATKNSNYLKILRHATDEDGILRYHQKYFNTCTGRVGSNKKVFLNYQQHNLPHFGLLQKSSDSQTTKGLDKAQVGSLFRGLFIPREGNCLYSADVESFEDVVLAYLLDREDLTFFGSSLIREQITAKCFPKLADNVPVLKGITLGMLRGLGVKGLKEQHIKDLMTEDEIKESREKFMANFKDLKAQNKIISNFMSSDKKGSIKVFKCEITHNKGKLIIKKPTGNHFCLDDNIKPYAVFCNIVQSVARDIFYKIIDLYFKPKYDCLINVHDEIIFECSEDERPTHSNVILELFELGKYCYSINIKRLS